VRNRIQKHIKSHTSPRETSTLTLISSSVTQSTRLYSIFPTRTTSTRSEPYYHHVTRRRQPQIFRVCHHILFIQTLLIGYSTIGDSYDDKPWFAKVNQLVTDTLRDRLSWIDIPFANTSSNPSPEVRLLDYACGPGIMSRVRILYSQYLISLSTA